MLGKGASYYLIRDIVAITRDTEIESGEEAVLRSIVADLTDAETSAALDDFFDFEPLTLAIYDQFRMRGALRERMLREKLAEFLIFCGHDDEAEGVLATL